MASEVNVKFPKWRLPTGVAVAIILSGCAAPGPVVIEDGGPDRDFDVSHIANAIPQFEPRTRAGNSNPYTVLGETYRLVETTEGFREEGVASWYGTKFHGRRTANGEIYDMYGMTAAHKTLPIPSYVRVTNRNNGNSVVVRINDRGPFHGGRIIDLTYTAAKQLGFLAQGTAPVVVEYIPMGEPQPVMASAAAPGPVRRAGTADMKAPTPENSAGYAIPENTFLQVGAFGSEPAARALQARLSELTDYPVVLKFAAPGDLVRVRVGPFQNNLDLMTLQQKLLDANLSEPHVVYE
jgi:rare lipoprotein A